MTLLQCLVLIAVLFIVTAIGMRNQFGLTEMTISEAYSVFTVASLFAGRVR